VPVLHGDPCNGVRHAICHDVWATGTRAVDGLELVNQQVGLRANGVGKLTAALACTAVIKCASGNYGPNPCHLVFIVYRLAPHSVHCTTKLRQCAQNRPQLQQSRWQQQLGQLLCVRWSKWLALVKRISLTTLVKCTSFARHQILPPHKKTY